MVLVRLELELPLYEVVALHVSHYPSETPHIYIYIYIYIYILYIYSDAHRYTERCEMLSNHICLKANKWKTEFKFLKPIYAKPTARTSLVLFSLSFFLSLSLFIYLFRKIFILQQFLLPLSQRRYSHNNNRICPNFPPFSFSTFFSSKRFRVISFKTLCSKKRWYLVAFF